jgi:hypothetical protein
MANDPYEVGYRKPPKATRFQKGTSGNPKGRPKGAKNLATLLDQAINERVSANVNGKPRRISKLQAAITQVVNRAAAGDPKFLRQLFDLVQALEGRVTGRAEPARTLTAEDLDVIDRVADRIDRIEKGPEDV